jgi:4-amino-4-deoxy-L-arabinose transferase-like glycosyltransferase
VSGKSFHFPILILLLASAIRFHALGWDARFHPDEALFATFARSAAVQGDWLLHGPLDKTPLSIYANALSMMLVGMRPLPNGVLTLEVHQGEFAARLPATFASILLVAVMYAAARTLYRRRGSTVPRFAMLLTAFSPLAVAFSATAFTDGLMLLCIALAFWQAGADRWLWAGVWLALGYACKQQALLYLPLLALLYLVPPRRRLIPAMLRLLLPLALMFGLLALWDHARGEITGVWALALANNEPSRLVRSDEVIPRLAKWADYAGTLAAPLTLPLAVLALTGFISRLRRQPRRSDTFIDLLLVLYIVVYAGLHWLVALNIYDRYLLPLLPPILLLLARGLEWGWGYTKGKLHRSSTLKSLSVYGEGFRVGCLAPLLLCVFAFCLFASWQAAEGRTAVGGDRGEHTGIDRLAAYLESKPLGTIIYDHWLGWELGYYLGMWSDKRRVYYPDPDALAADARSQADPAPRYFPAPAGQPISPWLEALREAGFSVSQVYQESGFVVYQLIPPAGG